MASLLTRAAHDAEAPQAASTTGVAYRPRAAVCLAGLAVLLALTALSRAPLVYDEAPYLKPVALLHAHGLSLRFLHDYPEPAGLLHNVLHWALEPWTALKPPAVRLVNPVLLVLTIGVSYLTLRLLGADGAFGTSVAVVGIPSIWNLTGMVLTEMPAIFFMSLSVYLLFAALERAARGGRGATVAAVAGGVALGLAFLSRASVLVVVGAVPCLAARDWKRAGAYACGALLVAGPVIAFWGGLVPPGSVVAVAPTGVSVYNLVLSFCYGATMMLLLAPGWFDLPARWALAVGAAAATLNALTGWVELPVLRSVVARLPAAATAIVPRAAGSAMLALAVLFVVCSLRHAYTRRQDRTWLFLCVAMLLVLASPAKITHQFSSRYTALASGAMVGASSPFTARAPWSVLGPVVGMLIGLSSLLSYYALAAN